MPEISRFLGIIIAMYHREHGVPHFHVAYSEYDATIDIATGGILSGKRPRKVLARMRKWRDLHHDELIADWRLAIAREPLNKIEPLE